MCTLILKLKKKKYFHLYILTLMYFTHTHHQRKHPIAPPARFSQLPDSERSRSVEVGRPIALQCELSDPTGQVYWYKDGTKLQQQSGLSIQSDGIKRTLVVQAAEFCHSGMYSCKTKGDAVQFNVDVKGDSDFMLAPLKKLTIFCQMSNAASLAKQLTAMALHVGSRCFCSSAAVSGNVKFVLSIVMLKEEEKSLCHCSVVSSLYCFVSYSFIFYIYIFGKE